MPDGGPEPHPDLAPLRFLLGRWEGAGVGGYPTIESFHFGQEINFSHNGKPFLIYTSRSWLLDDEGVPGRPLGMETGFWRPQPEGKVEVLLAHPTGITEIYLGEVTGTKIEMADGHRRAHRLGQGGDRRYFVHLHPAGAALQSRSPGRRSSCRGRSRGASATVAALTVATEIRQLWCMLRRRPVLAVIARADNGESAGDPGAGTWPFTPTRPAAYARISPIDCFDAVSARVMLHTARPTQP